MSNLATVILEDNHIAAVTESGRLVISKYFAGRTEPVIVAQFGPGDCQRLLDLLVNGMAESVLLSVGDLVFVTDGVDEYEAVIVQWNGDDTLTVMSEATGNRYMVPRDAIRRPEI